METFGFMADILSVISFFLSIFAVRKVYKFKTELKDSVGYVSQKARGENIKQAGRDIN